MAQLRHEYHQFLTREAEVIAVGPEDRETFRKYWSKNSFPFIGLPDPHHTVLDLYGQEVHLLKLGRMPAQFIIDKEGKVRFIHYGNSMEDITSIEEMTRILDQLRQ